MITVRFHGCLKAYGSRFTLHADTPAEALRALFLQIDGLRQMVADGYFLVRLNGAVVAESEAEQVLVNPASGELHLIPRIAGAGRAGQLVAGVALIAFAWWNPFATDPTAREVNIRKTFVRGTAALAPNGQAYQTDFDNDSVRARNYTAVLIEKG